MTLLSTVQSFPLGRLFSSSAIPFPEGMVLELGKPIPRVLKPYHITLPSIHSDNFFEALEELITKLHYDPQEQFSIILQPILSNGQRRTLGHSFNTNIQPKMDLLKDWLQPLIDAFEAQSGSGDGTFTDSTLVVIRNVSALPEPEAIPISSSKANVKYIADTYKADKQVANSARKAVKSPTVQAMKSMSQDILQSNQQILQAMQQQPSAILGAFKSQGSVAPVDWRPVIQGALTGLAQAFGAQVTFAPTSPIAPSTAPAPPTIPAAPASQTISPENQARLEKLEVLVSQQSESLGTLTNTVTQLSQGQAQLVQTVGQLSQSISQLAQVIAGQAQSPPNSEGSNYSGSNGSGDSTPSSNGSSDPSTSASSSDLPEITQLKEVTPLDSYGDKIVTADLEALITKEGQNQVYMAA